MQDYDNSESDDNSWISSGSDYSHKAEYKQAILAMEAMKSCREARSKEMKPGFWNNKIDKNGNAIKIWNEDQRKVFINSVIAFEDLMSSELIADENFKEKKEEIDTKIKTIFDKYSYPMYEFDSMTQGWKKTGNKIMPQPDEEILIPSPHNPQVLINIKGGWDFKINAYYDELVPVYDMLLKEIRNVIYRAKDFKKKTVIG